MTPNGFGETVGDVEAEAIVNTMHHSLAEVEVKVQASAYTLADMLAKKKTETLSEKLQDVNARTLDEIRH